MRQQLEQNGTNGDERKKQLRIVMLIDAIDVFSVCECVCSLVIMQWKFQLRNNSHFKRLLCIVFVLYRITLTLIDLSKSVTSHFIK